MSLTELIAWIKEHDVLLWWVMAGSAALTVGTILALPWVVSRIPDDYFATKERQPISETSQHPVLRWTFRVGRNLLGVILLLLGLIMLVGPGQGLIAVLAGLLLTEFPGKRRLEMWVIRRPGLLKGINWLRVRRGRPPLVVWSPEKKRLPGPQPEPRERAPLRH
ncbi:MAG: PGPGW domain-containing protein [Planctomycetaceae bacterium]